MDNGMQMGAVQRKRSFLGDYIFWLLKTLTLVVLVFIALPIMIGAVVFMAKDGGTSVASKDKQVAVVEVAGAIMDSKEVVADLYENAYNSNISGIVLRIDSPGGAIGPSQEIYEAVKELKQRKPIIVSMASVAASGGLYASLAATKVWANPGTVTGSIGVIMQFPNFQQVADKVGIDMVTIKSGKLKDVGNPFREMSAEELDYLNSTIRAAQEQFVAAVAEGRGLEIEKVKTFADGRILTGLMAKELGLVDELGGLHSAARSVFEELGEPLKDDEFPKLVYPADKFSQFKDLLTMVGLNKLIDLSSRLSGPRFLYHM